MTELMAHRAEGKMGLAMLQRFVVLGMLGSFATVAMLSCRAFDDSKSDGELEPGVSVQAIETCAQGPLVFTGTPWGTSFSVPAGCQFMLVKAWGGGGNSRWADPAKAPGFGGGGGAIKAVFTVAPFEPFTAIAPGRNCCGPGWNGLAARLLNASQQAILVAGGAGGGGYTYNGTNSEWEKISVGHGGGGGLNAPGGKAADGTAAEIKHTPPGTMFGTIYKMGPGQGASETAPGQGGMVLSDTPGNPGNPGTGSKGGGNDCAVPGAGAEGYYGGGSGAYNGCVNAVGAVGGGGGGGSNRVLNAYGFKHYLGEFGGSCSPITGCLPGNHSDSNRPPSIGNGGIPGDSVDYVGQATAIVVKFASSLAGFSKEDLSGIGEAEPCPAITVDFSTDAAGNTIPHHAVLDEQYAAWGIHFNGLFTMGRTSIDFANFTEQPLSLNMICTYMGSIDSGKCVPPNGDYNTQLVVDLDFPVTYASIQGRTRADGVYDSDQLILTALDDNGNVVQTGPDWDKNGTYPCAPYCLPEAVLKAEVSDPQGMIKKLMVHAADTDGLGSLVLQPADCVNDPPVAQCQNVTIGADGTCSGAASVNAGSDDPDGDTITCTQTPPGPYSEGSNQVTLTCVDSSGASDSCSASVTVVDMAPPILQCPPNQTAECDNGSAIVTFAPIAADNCSPPSLTCSPPSGSNFPLGTATDTCTATDSAGNSASCSFDVTVLDTTPPVVAVTPVVYGGAPKHEYFPFSLSDCVVSVMDACTGPVDISQSGKIDRITSDEAEDAPGGSDGKTCNDILITGDTSALLRGERLGSGNGRVYTVHFHVMDSSGNDVASSCTVNVNHPPGQPAIDDGCAYCVGTGCGTCPGHDPNCN